MTFQIFRRKLKNFTFQRLWYIVSYNVCANPIWSTGSVLLLARPAGLPEPEERPFAGEIRAAAEADLPDCAAFEDPEGWIPAYREMLSRGDLVLFGYLDGACVFRCCLQHGGSCTHRRHTVRFTDSEAYIGRIFCLPAARRKGFHEAALRYLCAACPDRDLYAQVRGDNIPSLRGFFRTGFRPAFRLTVKKRFFRSTLDKIPLSGREQALIMENTMKAGKR